MLRYIMFNSIIFEKFYLIYYLIKQITSNHDLSLVNLNLKLF